jgi:hypothetical protein
LFYKIHQLYNKECNPRCDTCSSGTELDCLSCNPTEFYVSNN